MAVKVYGWTISPFVSRVLLCLEEAGVDYELVPMSRDTGDHRHPDHLARNPFGEVPVLEDGDLTLFESRAIARHVLRKYKPELLGSGSLEQSAMVDMWVEVEAHQMEPLAGAIIVECIVALCPTWPLNATRPSSTRTWRSEEGLWRCTRRGGGERVPARRRPHLADLTTSPSCTTSWLRSTPRWSRHYRTSALVGEPRRPPSS
ncbi:unnamed protein product [Miscanthus lutarioriparius]|uniref:glutathione transferase n=1 Tax=Miscanthus lutarioriparius TaxID=422564 RepID=A0A811SRX9_9POAL|nr:unnamed protein product [Miscanthus lutarioriparius]